MKKILSLGFVSVAVLLVSCGQKNLDNVIVTPDTPIEKREQAAKVCEPMVKYISCSLEKSSEAGK